MISLMKYTYIMEPEKVQKELDKLWSRYKEIINSEEPTWDEINEARSLLYLTGRVFCEQIAVEAIERRLHLLGEKFSLVEFLLSLIIISFPFRLKYSFNISGSGFASMCSLL